MILSDRTIKELIDAGYITNSELCDKSIQPASLDIRIGDSFSFPAVNSNSVIELDKEVEYTTITENEYLLLPQQFVLATTMEYIKLPNDIVAFVEGRSSIGRLGLFIQNAGWVDAGFEGQITLELFNASRYAINIKTGTRIGQLVFAKMDYEAENPYRGKYQGQIGATGSMAYRDYI